MPTVLDAFMVTLSLDTSGLNNGVINTTVNINKISNSANNAQKNIDLFGRRATDTFRKVRNELLGLVSIFTAGRGIGEFVEFVVSTDAALKRMSVNTNTSTETLSAWGGAVESVGGHASTILGTIQGLQQQFAQFAMTGQSAVIPYFRALNVAVADSSGKLRPMNDIMLDLADKFQSLGGVKANFFGQALGFNQDTINLLLLGRSAVAGILRDQKALGVTTEQDGKNAIELQKQVSYTQRAFESFGRTILNQVTPTIIDLLKWFDEWLKKNGDWIRSGIVDNFKDFSIWLKSIDWKEVIKGAGGFLKGVNEVVQALGGWKLATEVLFGIWIGAKFIAVIANVMRLVAAARAATIATAVATGGVVTGAVARVAATSAAGIAARVAIGAASVTGLATGAAGVAALGSWYLAYKRIRSALEDNAKAHKNDIQPTDNTKARLGGAITLNSKDTTILFSDLENKNGLPKGLLDKDWAAESNRGKNMRSPAGAKGHFQFMDGTAKQYNLDDPFDLAKSATAAAHYFKTLIKHYAGNIEKAVGAYNWGQRHLDNDIAANGSNWRDHLPTETRNYIRKVTAGLDLRPGAGYNGGSGGGAGGGHSVVIGSLVIHSQATDAHGIARDIHRELNSRTYTNQASYGLA